MAASARRIDKLIDAWDPILQQAFLRAVYNMRKTVHMDALIRQIEAGDTEGALRAVNLNPAAFRPYDAAVSAAFEAGGTFTAGLVPKNLVDEDGFRVNFQFNIRNPEAERWLAENSSTKITEIISDQRDMIREHLRDGMAKGQNPRTTALDLVGRLVDGEREGGVIGLTSSQAEWVRNYREELEDGDRGALSRALRDGRFDSLVERAIENDADIDPDDIEKMVSAYKNRALRYRAENIARSEAMSALHEAQEQSIDQMVDSGTVTQTAVSYAWRTADDNRVRDSHAEMDGQEVQYGENFTTGNGVELEYPGDPKGPPEEVLNCRCWREPIIDFLEGIE